tara:strand:+ start:59591 stop:60661 length:1071 start_codon:yes stop_codon:yes gene_type:complete
MPKILKKINIGGDLFSDTNINYKKLDKIFNNFSDSNTPLILNLEGSINFHNRFVQKNKSVPLSLDISLLDYLSKFNIIVSLANNHILDFGNFALARLINLLEERSIPYFGIKDSSDISGAYIYLGNDMDGNELIVAGCGWSHEQVITKNTYGYSCVEFEYKALKNLYEHINYHFKSPRILLYAHYGYEYEYWPLPLHVQLTRDLIDLGFSGILGSHTHTIQAFEKWKNKPIYHGLGNFFFYSKKIKHSRDNTLGRLVSLDIDNKFLNPESYLIRQDLLLSSVSIEEDNSKSVEISRNLKNYSSCYKFIRLRQSNPRPILYPNKKLQNYVKYKIWFFIVMFLGLIRCRGLVKRILSW